MSARSLPIAIRFLTRLPIPGGTDPEPDDLGRSVVWYPLVGLLIGLVLLGAGALWAEAPPMLAAALLLALWVGLTGGLHLDGLADSADAWLGGGEDPERALAILRDPYAGPAGVAAIALVLVVKLAALEALLGTGTALGLLTAPMLARAGTVWLLLVTPYVRAEGLGAALSEKVPPLSAWTALAAALALGLFLGGKLLFGALVTATVVLIFLRWLMLQHLGGLTGDTLGAAVEVTEAVILAVLAFWLG